jgi:hypothetical protein
VILDDITEPLAPERSEDNEVEQPTESAETEATSLTQAEEAAVSSDGPEDREDVPIVITEAPLEPTLPALVQDNEMAREPVLDKPVTDDKGNVEQVTEMRASDADAVTAATTHVVVEEQPNASDRARDDKSEDASGPSEADNAAESALSATVEESIPAAEELAAVDYLTDNQQSSLDAGTPADELVVSEQPVLVDEPVQVEVTSDEPRSAKEPNLVEKLTPVPETVTEPEASDNNVGAVSPEARLEEPANNSAENLIEKEDVRESPTAAWPETGVSPLEVSTESVAISAQNQELISMPAISGDNQAEVGLSESDMLGPSATRDTEQLIHSELGEVPEPIPIKHENSEVPVLREGPLEREAQDPVPEAVTKVPSEPDMVDDFVLVEPEPSSHGVPEFGDQVQARSADQDSPQLPVEELTSIPTEIPQAAPSSTQDADQGDLAEQDAKAADHKTIAVGTGVLGAVGITSAVMVNELFSNKGPEELGARTPISTDLSSVVRSRAVAPSSTEASISDEPALQAKIDDFEKLSHPAAEVRSISSMDLETKPLAEERASLSESFPGLEKGPATRADIAVEKKVEADTTDSKKPTVVSVVHEGTQTDHSFPDERTLTPSAAAFSQSVRPGISSEILRAPTPAMVIPDLDDPVAQQLSRARSVRKQRRNTIKKAEELVAAAVVIKAAVDAVSPTHSPQRLASPVNELASFAMRSKELKEEERISQPVFLSKATAPADGESRGRTRTRSIGAEQEVALRSSVADLFLDEKDTPKDEAAAPAPKTEETKPVTAAPVSPKRTSHHSSRRHSHHRDREPGSNKDSPRRTHRHRSDSYTSSRSGGEVAEPHTPKGQDSGLSADSSSHSRRRRTPEEQAAHEKRKEERRLREKEKERESSKGKSDSPSSPKEKSREKGKEPATSTSRERPTSSSHSHHRISRRHSKSEGTSRPEKASTHKAEATSPSPAGSKKLVGVKDGQSVLDSKVPSPAGDAVPATAAAPAKDKESSKPEFKRSRSTRHSSSAIANVLRKSEEKIRSSHRTKESKKEVKESASGSSGNEGEGTASHAAHRAKRQERREKAKEDKKPGFRAAIKRFFTS